MDACLLAAVAALQNTTLPPIVVQDYRVYTLESEEERNNLQGATTFPSKKLSMPVIPLPLSMGYVRIPGTTSKEAWLVDPTKEEEAVCKGGITVVVDGKNTDQILSLEYKGEASMTQSNLALALKMAQGRAKELLSLIGSQTK